MFPKRSSSHSHAFEAMLFRIARVLRRLPNKAGVGAFLPNRQRQHRRARCSHRAGAISQLASKTTTKRRNQKSLSSGPRQEERREMRFCVEMQQRVPWFNRVRRVRRLRVCVSALDVDVRPPNHRISRRDGPADAESQTGAGRRRARGFPATARVVRPGFHPHGGN